jgi:hypothetical protein
MKGQKFDVMKAVGSRRQYELLPRVESPRSLQHISNEFKFSLATREGVSEQYLLGDARRNVGWREVIRDAGLKLAETTCRGHFLVLRTVRRMQGLVLKQIQAAPLLGTHVGNFFVSNAYEPLFCGLLLSTRCDSLSYGVLYK